jgi:hypothetical protein
MLKLTENEITMVQGLRQKGFAVCIFNPDELGDASPDKAEERMCAAGWDVIEEAYDAHEEDEHA